MFWMPVIKYAFKVCTQDQGVSQPDGTAYTVEFPIGLKFPKGQK